MLAAPSAAPAGAVRARARRAADDGDVAGLGRARAAAFVAPSLVLIGVFLVFPALWTLYLGLTNYRLSGSAALHPKFVGIQNYLSALSDDRFANSLVLTLAFVFGSAVIGQSVLGFSIAWLATRLNSTVRSVVEFFVLLAWIIPSSVTTFLWYALLDGTDGTLNSILGTAHLAWLLQYPLQCIIVFNTWVGTAFSMMLFSSALASVPPSQLETARMAGAGTFAQFRDVIFPHIRGHALTNTLLITLWTFNTFTPYLLTAGGPDDRSNILPIFIYRLALNDGALGQGAAISLIMIVINLVIATVYLRLLKERKK
ncbi:ABC transporter permease [Sinomonas atrocyanea]|uniref:ABC transporter permease n=1 Tax=Sinomonas atrocyanea TaxID=37927 RepID=A0A126ZWS5_9MICC|nr:ABC transporter permease [Sinomonas atrocyanea]GEB65902.1 amino acid ABC transporter permease [Sinomonas atrocyanea]GGG74748.1 amino acid ABC transporter permease [Sinomonas atrocyanea]